VHVQALPVAASLTYGHTAWRGQGILSISLQLQTRRDELKARGKSLFNDEYLKHPAETQLALEIKEFDDQVAECVQQLGRRTQGSSEQ
jgi:hypothetical protein